MVIEHSWAGVSHHLADLFAELGFVAVNCTLLASGFVITEGAFVQTTVSIALELGTFVAELALGCAMLLLAVELEHCKDHLLFITNTHGTKSIGQKV